MGLPARIFWSHPHHHRGPVLSNTNSSRWSHAYEHGSCDTECYRSVSRTSGLRRVAEQQSTLELMRTMIEAKGGRKKIFFHKYWRVNSGNNARSLLFLADSHDLNRSTVLDPEAHIRMLMSHPHPWPCRTKTHRTGECHLWPYLCGCIIFSPNPCLPCPLY